MEKKSKAFSFTFMKKVFSSLEKIYTLHQILLEELLLFSNLDAYNNPVGSIVLNKMLVFRQLYPPYILNLSKSKQELREKLESNKQLASFLKECQERGEEERKGNLLDLQSLLIIPLNRISLYQRELEVIKDSTPEYHIDYYPLLRSMGEMADLKEYVSVSKALTQLNQVESKVNSLPHSLSSPFRFLRNSFSSFLSLNTLEESGSNKWIEVQCWLFNDLLLLARKSSKNNFKFELSIRLHLSKLIKLNGSFPSILLIYFIYSSNLFHLFISSSILLVDVL